MSNAEKRATASLVGPFFVIGLCGGLLIARGFVHDEYPGENHVVACTALAGAALGWLLGRRKAAGAVWTGTRAALSTLIAGGVNGAIVAPFMVNEDLFLGIFLSGAVVGGLLAVLFVPATALAAVVARRRARPGSLIDRLDRHAVWLAALATVPVACLLFSRGGGLPVWMTMVSLVGLLGLVGRAVELLREVSSALTCIAELRPRGPDAAVPNVQPIDLGVGLDQWVALEPGDEPYRQPERVTAWILGDPALARSAAQSARWMHGTAAMVMIIATLAVVTRAVWH